LVEVLIAIGIIGLLLALLTPAIQAARDASRRTQCMSNLRQLGLALQAYHDVHHRFPPAVIWSPPGEPLGEGLAPPGVYDRVSAGVASPDEPDRLFANWVIMLLPFIEEQPLHETYDPGVPLAAPANQKIRATDIPLLKCPSDSENGSDKHFLRGGLMNPDQAYARGNYGINAGPNERCLAHQGPENSLETCSDGFQVNGTDLRTDTSQVWGSGIAGLNRSFRIVDFVSGTSKVVAIEELRAGVDVLDRRGVWSLGLTGSSVTAAHGLKGNAAPNAGTDRIQGCSAVCEHIGDPTIWGMPCERQRRPEREVCDRATARSQHYSGVNVAMADGSARFVSNNIDADIWEKMHKRNNQVPLSLEFEE
jgi:prepilin-type processing-associated H-X9-DG protein